MQIVMCAFEREQWRRVLRKGGGIQKKENEVVILLAGCKHFCDKTLRAKPFSRHWTKKKNESMNRISNKLWKFTLLH